ncbi:MAG: hypothetical protein SWY16_04495 [Cyanobacteriota bacterium]|nr:hypothetical protein [Cyanobacteriota bacterium]
MIKNFRILNLTTWGCLGFVGFLLVSTAVRFLARAYPVLNLIFLTVLFLGIAVFIWILLSPQFQAPLKLDAIETAVIIALALILAYGDALVRLRLVRHVFPARQHQPDRPPASAPPIPTVDAAAE